MTESSPSKACIKCGVIKPLDEFHRKSVSPDGRQPDCKVCRRAMMNARYAADPEGINNRRRVRREADLEAARERDRAYYAANAEQKAAAKRAKRAADPERARAMQRAWRIANLEKVRANARARYAANPSLWWVRTYRQRARGYGHPVVVEDFTRDDVVARYGDACWHCGGDFEELDHHPIPVADGGHHTLDNVRPSCAACNRPGRSSTREDP